MNPDEIILFVGGPYDGKRKRWGTTQPMQKVLTMTSQEPQEDIYRIEVYKDASTRHQLAIHEGCLDVLEKLISGYNPQK